jgi:hypothetical protein
LKEYKSELKGQINIDTNQVIDSITKGALHWANLKALWISHSMLDT